MNHVLDPNAAAKSDSGIFGLPFSYEESKLVYIPVPWEVTTSYGGGTSNGPQAIFEASKQVDLFDIDLGRPYESGLFMLEESEDVRSWNKKGRALAEKIIEVGGDIAGDSSLEDALREVNVLGEKLNQWVYAETKRHLENGKMVALIGGDHSTPFGALKAICEKVGPIGVLHFDAHSDTRIAYEGFTWSHASIMYNALEKIPQIETLVQVGIRDFCEQEYEYAKSQGDRVAVYYDETLKQRRFKGETWDKIAQEIIEKLPPKVWISFDIDGLDPRFCPHTGTPVPGGLEFSEATYLIKLLARSGRQIVGFDLNEVAPSHDSSDEWDANVGARLLYKMSGWALGE